MSQQSYGETVPWDFTDDGMFAEPTPGYQRQVDPPVIPLASGQAMPPSPSVSRRARSSRRGPDSSRSSAVLDPNTLAPTPQPQQVRACASIVSRPGTASFQPAASADEPPAEIWNIVNIINSLPKSLEGLPLKTALRHHRDLRGEIQSGTGLLKVYSSQLRLYLNGERIFSGNS
ncbi:hypothetical protein K431DRAFT_307088 [Polychaeton citri CBS 116435]|uniref:Uncharacterized protein n=1 Tax=Polychaeton citri CBS 116435 TaxID=1314669 RepID=A0A9P4UKA0_9PEZI|nr:hypothetical protein K431DRAFT_307088 [Polychaeton citri CBS 116435]